jgi:hypothetical protein
MSAQRFCDLAAIGRVLALVREVDERSASSGPRDTAKPLDERIPRAPSDAGQRARQRRGRLVASTRHDAREREPNRRAIFGGRLGEPLEQCSHAGLASAQRQRERGVQTHAGVIVTERA